MKIFTVVGISNSGKTTVVEGLIKELKARGYSVGSVKAISCGTRCHLLVNGKCKCSAGRDHRFTIDTNVKNSARHRLAGSSQVTTWAENETAVMYQRELEFKELVDLYDYDYLIFEGDYYNHAPRIVTAPTEKSARERITDMTFAVCGRLCEQMTELDGLPVINPLSDIATLADLVEKKVFPMLPEVDNLNCGLCGSSCKELSVKILRGEASVSDCMLIKQAAVLSYNNNRVELSAAQQKKLLTAINRALEENGLLPSNVPIEINVSTDGY
ncbi:molybdopterin-guanine dinucleotide biosynthesis protein MobB [Hydrogenoanaerobacterium sp.]|uniref:molybdopterin-guanine dinucleotide biosynthesis protein B n=1 Tax=Hydrogenoanaerobacterium sp. TaxID=2953763 RepID=UPI0028966D53|nr:molybdopterin-guanine dinucleotide biosynthesis protein MobB [Hydrogenoanaerobacterium sp.]